MELEIVLMKQPLTLYKSPMETEKRHIEEMTLPCVFDICDGSGYTDGISLEDEDTMCPCNPKHSDNTSEFV